MEVPLNIVHNYIAAPVFFGISIDMFRRYNRSGNKTSLYFAIAILLGALSVTSFGVPVIFTHDINIVALGTFLGDVFFAVAMLFLWLINIRAFLDKRRGLANIAIALVGVLTALCVAFSVGRNFVTPEHSIEITRVSGRLALLYHDPLSYKIVSGLDSIALALTAVFFWLQSRTIADRGQRIRIRGIAAGFLLGASAFIVAPGLPVENQFRISVMLWISSCAVMSLFGIIGWVLSYRAQAPTTTNLTEQ